MITRFFISLLLLSHSYGFGQKVEKVITEKSISRIIKTLSSDAMMGRSALAPESIEAATSFIEGEFGKIGLQPLPGLEGFRQTFVKERVSPEFVQVIVDGKEVPAEEIVVFSDHEQINISDTRGAISLNYDSSVKNKNQHFFSNAFAFTRDTTASIMFIPPDYRESFAEFKQYFEEHFTNKRKHDKVFILGEPSTQSCSIEISQKYETIRMNNVVGVIPGKTKPDEMVLFSAHYDHVGLLPAVAGDSIANGADDDASGTTAVIELARYFTKADNNNRTIIFVAFTAEEIGGYGSQYFSQQLDPDKIVAMFNIEMIGKPSRWGLNAAFVTGYERSDLGSILERNVQGTGFTFKPDPYPDQNLFYRSDNATLARLGVPAHTISTDQIDTDPYYHTVNDELETLDIRNITKAIRAIAIGSRSVIDGTDTPKRIDKASVQ